MRNAISILALSTAVLAGCYTSITTDSSHYLTPDQSAAVVPEPVDATTLEVVRLFSTRGIVVVDRQPSRPAGSVLVKLVGLRGQLGRRNEAHAIGSVYYARIEPISSGSKLTLVGAPMIDGAVPCTAGSPGAANGECPEVSIESHLADWVNGQEEAAMIHGVLAELALDDRHPDPAATASANAQAIEAGKLALDAAAKQHAACRAQRHDIAMRAEPITDLDARAKLLQTMPDCDAVNTAQ